MKRPEDVKRLHEFQKMDLVRDDYFGLGVVIDIEDGCYVIRWITQPANNLARFCNGLSRVPINVIGPFASAWKSRLKFVCHG